MWYYIKKSIVSNLRRDNMDSFGTRLKALRKQKKLTQKKLAQDLGLAQTTIANYEGNLRLPGYDILNTLAKIFDVSIDFLIDGEKQPLARTLSYKAVNLDQLKQIYLRELLDGNKGKVYDELVQAMEQGVRLQDLYMNVIEPALIEIGQQWEENKISVGHEHYFSEATVNILAQLNSHIRVAENKKYRAVLLCTHGEEHSIALKMINNLLEEDGWETYFMGTNVPMDSLLLLLKEKDIDLVALSITMNYHLNGTESLVKVIKNSNLKKPVKILVGGRALSHDPLLWRTLGADGFANSFEEIVGVCNKLVNE